MLIKAPPLLPGLIAASVWITSASQSSVPSPFVSTGTARFRPEIIPCVTEPENSVPSGLPIAIAGSPSFNESESPNAATVVTFLSSISRTAKSFHSSVPSNFASDFFTVCKSYF